jgi:chloramphenicol-sensitive protein RarD
MPSPTADQEARQQARAGLAYGVAAYLWWGLAPFYFKAVSHVLASEVLAHRVVWSLLLLSVLMRWRGRWGAALATLRDRRTVITLLGTTVLIAANWFTFIWAIAHGQLLQASLGYFINPLVNVLLGFVFLHERLRTWQKVSVALATVGVAYLTWQRGEIPVLALVLAGTFALYGLLRKVVRVDAMTGLTVETLLLAPVALVYMVFLEWTGVAKFGSNLSTTLLLPLGGVITAVPLLWFANAVRRLRLATIGFLQYLAPSLQFLLAVAAFGEPLTRAHVVSFGCIWAALVIYSIESATILRRATVRPVASPSPLPE